MRRAFAALALALVTFAAAASAQAPEPPPPAKARIFVPTALPHGSTTSGAVDVTYDAEPGGGAHIAQVAYSINGGPWEYVYLRGGATSQKGALGRARVMLAPGENRIVFRAIDSAGNTATCAVPGAPFYDFGAPPDRAGALLAPSAAGGGAQYATDCIVAIANNGTTDAQVAQAAQAIGGAIAGRANPVGMYWLRVPGGTEAHLMALCARLLADYPDVFAAASLDTLHPIDIPVPGADVVDDHGSAQADGTNDPWWDWYEWGLTAMNVPSAWEAYQGALHETKVGVVDDGFRRTHEDLQLPAGNVHNYNIADKDHGSHVMGTIGAVHNNAKGLAGVMDAQRTSLYGYDAFAVYDDGAYDSDIIAGMGWDAANGAKAINFSLGGNWPYDPEEDALYSAALRNLLEQGYDFVVVHAAGNDAVNANRSGCFASVTDPELRQRIITVGAVDRYYQLAYFTNYGPLVDVVAPGVNIYSSVAWSDSSYASYYSGTSMSAPHITGLAGLVWSVDPGLTGNAVKRAIVDSAHESGRAITDTRSSVPSSMRLTYYLPDAKAVLDRAAGGAVYVAPKAVTLATGGTQTFTATVTLAGSAAVIWTASGGSITQGGAYTAPATPGAYTVTATSAEDGAKYDTAAVTVVVPVSVSVSPKTVTLTTGAVQTFAATVTGGAGNTAVAWTANGGVVTPGGVYTAPPTPGEYTVTATSLEDSAKSDTAAVTVAPRGTVTIANPPGGLFVGRTATFSASVTGLSDASVAWTASAGAMDSQSGGFTAPDAPQTVTVMAASVQEPLIRASVQVKVSAADFDGNAAADPQLLGLAAAFDSAWEAGRDELYRYDFDGSGGIDDGDLSMLFDEMGW